MPRWARGFREKIEAITGEWEFTYCLAVTRLQGDAAAWSGDPTIRECLGGNPFRVPYAGGHVGVVLPTVKLRLLSRFSPIKHQPRRTADTCALVTDRAY